MGGRIRVDAQPQSVGSERRDWRVRTGRQRRRPKQPSTRRKRAFPAWSVGSIQDRANLLDKVGSDLLARKDEIGRLLAREEGKTLPEGVGETVRAGHIFKFFAGEVLRLTGEKISSVRPGVDVEITREPVGVVGLITPWNFPIAIPAWKIAPALAFGNTVVFKPAQWTPGCAWALTEILANAGVPAGVFNLVMGSGSVVGETIVNHPDVAALSFTGSMETGRAIARKAITRMAKFQLEMGSKNPLVVLDDADLPTAVNVAVQGAYFSTGQRCTASSRLIVTEGIHNRFVEALTRETVDAEGRQRAHAGNRDRPGRRTAPARYGSRVRRRSVSAKERGSSRAAIASSARPTATTWRRRSSWMPPTRCASRAKRSSGRSRASFARRTTTRRSRLPTIPIPGCPRASSRRR